MVEVRLESDRGGIRGKVIGRNMDNQIRTTFQRALKKQKIDFKMETAVKKAEKMPDGKIELTIEKVSTKEESKMIADVVLVSTEKAVHGESRVGETRHSNG